MAYTSDKDNVNVFNQLGGGVWVAPKGSTLPTDLTTDPASPFEPVGWISEDGVSYELEKNIEDYRAWQGSTLVRRSVTEVTQTWTFACLEGNELVQTLAHSGNAGVVSGVAPEAISTRDLTGQNKTVERALVIDAVDSNGTKERWTVSAADISLAGEMVLGNGEVRVYEFTATALADAAIKLISNSPQLVAAP